MAKPKLRFSEFADEWKEIRLKEVVNKVGSGKTPKGGATVYQNKGIMLLRSQNVQNGFLDLEDVVYISDEINQTMKNSNVKTGDLLFNITGASIGRCCIYLLTYEANVNQHVCIIRLIPNENVHFYMQYILTRQIQNQIPMLQTGGGREGLNFESVKAIKLYRPNFNEQKKLAEFLSSVDTVIKVQEEKVSALEEQKKGVMQKLFNREVRFKTNDGNEYPEWEEKLIGDLMEVTSVKRVHESDWVSSGIPFYRAREIIALHNGECITPLYISHELFKENSRLSGKIKEGDLLVTGVGTIGIQYLVKASDEFYFKDGNIIWLKNENRIHGKYFYYCYDSTFVKNQINSMAGIGTVGTYTIDSAKKTRIFVPCLEEQQKIADCLSAYDEAIQIKKEKLEIWKEIKKGLLQQMFV